MNNNLEKTDEQWREEAREDIYRRVRVFEGRTNAKRASKSPDGNYTPVAKAALYNHALSLLNVEYYKLLKEDRTLVLQQYQ